MSNQSSKIIDNQLIQINYAKFPEKRKTET